MKSLRRKNAEKIIVATILCALVSCLVCIPNYYCFGESGLISLLLPMIMAICILRYIQDSETTILSLPCVIVKRLKTYEQKYGKLVNIKLVYDNVEYTGCFEYDTQAHHSKKKDLIFESGKVISFEEYDFEVTKIIGEEKAGLI